MKEMVGYHIHLSEDQVDVNDFVECRTLSLSHGDAAKLFRQRMRKPPDRHSLSRHHEFLSRPISEEISDSISHWIDRDWDAQLPSFGMSRIFEFHDVGPDREQKLKQSHDEYGLLKQFPDFEPMKGIAISSVPHDIPEKISLHKVYKQRRSFRRFSVGSIELQEFLSFLGSALYRLTRTARENSAQGYAKYSYGIGMNIIVAVFDISGLQPGLYHYEKLTQKLVLICAQDREELRQNFRDISYGFKAAATANFSVVLLCDFRRYYWLYRHVREMRNIFIESGRIMQDLVFFGAHHGLNCVMTPAIHEAVFYKSLLQRKHEVPVYLACFGKVGG
jgi:nitroreductase